MNDLGFNSYRLLKKVHRNKNRGDDIGGKLNKKI